MPRDASNIALRWLRQRDQARAAGDRLARAVAAQLRGEQVDLAAALQNYGEDDGPWWASEAARQHQARGEVRR